MENKKVKVTNPYPHAVGLRLMDGLREMVVHPKSFVLLDADEIYYIHNSSTLFRDRKLVVQDDEVNENLGFHNDQSSVVTMSDAEIESLLKGNIASLKKYLKDVDDKLGIDRIGDIARKMEDLASSKLKLIQEVSGYNFEQLLKSE